MTITLPKTCLTGIVAALLLPLALTACGSDEAAATDRLAATEAAAKRAEDAAKRAEDAVKAAKIAGNGSVYANDPGPLDVPVAPPQDDAQGAAQPNPDAVPDIPPQPPRNPA